jgi:hypothetical protein
MGTNIFSSRMFMDAVRSPHFIVCECGAKILLLPDPKLMSNSIEAHAQEHKQMGLASSTGEDIECVRIENFLIEQFFKKVIDNQPKP